MHRFYIVFQIRFLLFITEAFTLTVISVQEVSKESQELMRKALEEVCFAFCSLVVVVVVVSFCFVYALVLCPFFLAGWWWGPLEGWAGGGI